MRTHYNTTVQICGFGCGASWAVAPTLGVMVPGQIACIPGGHYEKP